VVKNWFDDLCLNCTPNVDLKDYMKVEVVLVEENYQLIKKLNTSKNCKLIGLSDSSKPLDLSFLLILFFLFPSNLDPNVFLSKFDVIGLAIYGLVYGVQQE